MLASRGREPGNFGDQLTNSIKTIFPSEAESYYPEYQRSRD